MIELSKRNFKDFDLDEFLFGNKRTLLIEQLSCVKNNEIRRKLKSEKVISAVQKAASKMNKRNRKPKADWVIYSSEGIDIGTSIRDYEIELSTERITGYTENII